MSASVIWRLRLFPPRIFYPSHRPPKLKRVLALKVMLLLCLTKCHDMKYLTHCLIKQHAMRMYWGSGSITPHVLNLCTRWGESSTLRPGRFTPWERTPGTHWMEGWAGPTAGLDAVAKWKKSQHLPGVEPRYFSPLPSHCADWATTAFQVFAILWLSKLRLFM
jgi:hypothetical protein